MVDYSRTLDRLIVAFRWLLFVCLALELTKGGQWYTALGKSGTHVLVPEPTMSSMAIVGVLAVWFAIASGVQFSVQSAQKWIPMAAGDAAVGLITVFTQKTLFAPMLFGLAAFEMFGAGFVAGLVTAVVLTVAYIGIVAQRDSAAIVAPPLLWYYAFMGMAAMAGGIFDSFRKQDDQSRALLTVIETSQELGTSASREKILSLVVGGVKGLFGCNSAVVYLKDQDKSGEQVLRVAESSTAFPDAFTDFAPNMKNSIIGTVVKDKKGKLVPDFKDYQPEEIIRKENSFRGAMAAPLLFEEEPLGAIFISHNNPSAYNESQFRLFSLLTTQVALAVRNMQLHEATATLAITDSLSGLYTHGYFQERLGEEILQAKRTSQVLSLMILDVDFFKKVNDTYGHPQGDALLKQLGGLMREMTRPTDILCRYGGDEFTIIMLNTNRISAVVIAERIREAVEGYEFVLGSQIVHITVSGGVASYPEDAETKKELVEKSDHAMYQAKQRGRNRVVFSS
jgi:diguanylate cyclase (GGDEF)-like protein